MGREHFTVGVDVDPFSLGLLQQKLKVLQIMTGHNNKRPFFYGKGHSGRFRCPIGLCIGLVQKCHALQVDFSDFQHGRKQPFDAFFITDSK